MQSPIVIINILFVLLCIPTFALSYQNEQDGFRNYKWKTTYESIQDNFPNKDQLTKTLNVKKRTMYYVITEWNDLFIGDIKADDILYYFSNDKKQLYKVTIRVKYLADDLEKIVIRKFGKPNSKKTEQDNSVVSIWKGKKTNLELLVSIKNGTSYAVLNITDATYKEPIDTDGF